MGKQTVFINYRGGNGLETVDEFSKEPNQSPKDFRKYVKDMLAEYNLAYGGGCYRSSRACKTWTEK